MAKYQKLGLLLSLLMAGSVWFYTERILIPFQKAEAATHNRPRGSLSDLYPRWLGARELLLHHRDPYSPEITREIQAGYYGRPLDPQNPQDPKDEQRFAYPVYVVFLLAPTIAMPFAVVQKLVMAILVIAMACSVPLFLRAMRWQPSYTVQATLIILTLGSFSAAQGIKLQQLTLLVTALLAASVALVSMGRFFFAGILLALTTIKPQLSVLLLAWLLFWAVNAWRERRNLVWGFFLAMAVLILGGEYVLPGWIGEFVDGLAAYNHYTGGRSLLDVVTSPKIGLALMLLVLAGAAFFGWRMRAVAADSAEFGLIVAFLLSVTLLVAPMMSPYNHVLLLPAVLLLARSWGALWRKGRITRLLCVLSLGVFFWPWVASVGLTLVAMFISTGAAQRGWAMPVWTTFYIPLVVLALVVICAVDEAKPEPVRSI